MTRSGAGQPLWAYGNSYAVVRPGPRRRLHYLTRAGARLGAPSVRSYAVNGTGIVDVVSALLAETPYDGSSPPVAGALRPWDPPRRGLVVLETMFNDVAHYADRSAFPPRPTPLAPGDTRYVDGVASLNRAALAVVSTRERVGHDAAELTGAWEVRGVLGPAEAVACTTSPGARAAFTVAPTATGPLAGTVHALLRTLDPSAGAVAPVEVAVDDGPAWVATPPAWEQYAGHAGRAVRGVVHCLPLRLPADGRSHRVALTHAGREGDLLAVDALLVASADPNRIVVMAADTPPRPAVWSADDVAVWEANRPLVAAAVRDVVAGFPNAVHVPSTMPRRGLSARDGIHPNVRGMRHRARDLLDALG